MVLYCWHTPAQRLLDHILPVSISSLVTITSQLIDRLYQPRCKHSNSHDYHPLHFILEMPMPRPHPKNRMGIFSDFGVSTGDDRIQFAEFIPFKGIGGFVSPFVCQTIIAKGVSWRNFYFGSIVVSTINTCFLAYAFRPTRKEFERDRRSALRFLEVNQHTKLGLVHESPVVGGPKVTPAPVASVPNPGNSTIAHFPSLSSHLTSTSSQENLIHAFPMDTLHICLDSQRKVGVLPGYKSLIPRILIHPLSETTMQGFVSHDTRLERSGV